MIDTGRTEQRAAREAFLEALVFDDPVQLYERAPCGFLSTTPDGLIVKCNATLRTWLGRAADEIIGRLSFADVLTRGSRIFHETHFIPALLMQGSVREIALDMVAADGRVLPVLLNATLDRDEAGRPAVIRVAVFDATERRSYERELVRAKERAEASEAQARSLARTLQQTLVPPTPQKIPGLEVAATYLPAADGLDVGGDFYDVFPVAFDDWVVVIGDVQGKGVDAAVVAGLVRHTLRALAVVDQDPTQVLTQVNTVLRRHGVERFCSVAMLRLHRQGSGWELVLGNGGHPPPVLIRRGERPEFSGSFGQLVGAFDTVDIGRGEATLRPGDMMLLYTDGVTDARRGDDLFGEERMLDALTDLPDDLESTVALLADATRDFQGDHLADDIAIVGLRVPD